MSQINGRISVLEFEKDILIQQQNRMHFFWGHIHKCAHTHNLISKNNVKCVFECTCKQLKSAVLLTVIAANMFEKSTFAIKYNLVYCFLCNGVRWCLFTTNVNCECLCCLYFPNSSVCFVVANDVSSSIILCPGENMSIKINMNRDKPTSYY